MIFLKGFFSEGVLFGEHIIEEKLPFKIQCARLIAILGQMTRNLWQLNPEHVNLKQNSNIRYLRQKYTVHVIHMVSQHKILSQLVLYIYTLKMLCCFAIYLPSVVFFGTKTRASLQAIFFQSCRIMGNEEDWTKAGWQRGKLGLSLLIFFIIKLTYLR